jgi:cold shock protein
MSEMQRGIVKWFNDAKGFGFIEHETGRDVFVHYSVIEADGFKTLKDGEIVDYELKEGDKGLHAARVIRKEPAPAPKKAKKGFGGGDSDEDDSSLSDSSTEDSEDLLSATEQE